MTWKPAAILVLLNLLPSLAADRPKGPKQSFEVTTTERFHFVPGGTVRVDNSYGYLSVEGWDETEVEVTVTKSTDRLEAPGWKEKAGQLFDQVRVVSERRSDKEIAISTTVPHRNSPLTSVLPSGRIIITTPVPPNHKRGVTVEYKIRTPRNSHLVVHHDNGYVWVSDVMGDIEVNSHTGDMIVMLPDPGPYEIDARTRLGRIAFDMPCESSNPLLAGGRLSCPAATPAARVRLRMGRGSIAIKNGGA